MLLSIPHAPWVHSLKEKRMIVKSFMEKLRNKFNVSVAEGDSQDIHQTIVVGVAAIVLHNAQADCLMEEIQYFIEGNTEAEIVDIERDVLNSKEKVNNIYRIGSYYVYILFIRGMIP